MSVAAGLAVLLVALSACGEDSDGDGEASIVDSVLAEDTPCGKYRALSDALGCEPPRDCTGTDGDGFACASEIRAHLDCLALDVSGCGCDSGGGVECDAPGCEAEEMALRACQDGE